MDDCYIRIRVILEKDEILFSDKLMAEAIICAIENKAKSIIIEKWVIAERNEFELFTKQPF